MQRILLATLLGVGAGASLCADAVALDRSVPAIGGDLSRELLGDGTGVVVGVIDSGLDETHPAFAGTDSLGQPRLVAEANFVPSEPANTGDDVDGHGTWVASVIGSADATYTGMAPDVGFINARVLDNNNGFGGDVQVRNGVGFAIDEGADVLNLSLNYFSTLSAGNRQLDLMLDWAAQERGVSCAICVGNINSTGPGVRGPGGAYNGITVGRTDSRFSRVHPNSATAFTQDGRMKPDVVAPGTSITMANDDWETQADFTSASGCSFATPHVAGLMAQQIEAGRELGLSTDPIVVKATMMNAASKSVLGKAGQTWSATSPSEPLDRESGAGQIDGVVLAEQYLAGEQSAGVVAPIGWDLGEATAGVFTDYVIEAPLVPDTALTATLTWNRNVSRTDRGLAGVDSRDLFVAEALDNLDLEVWADGVLVAESASQRDNVEHLFLPIEDFATYTLRVVGADIVGSGLTESFALAWSSVAIPEPAGLLLVSIVALGVSTCRVRREA